MPALRTADKVVGPFRERDTITIAATIVDNANVAIPVGSLISATWTLFNEKSPFDIINTRNHVNLLPNINSSGVLSLPLDQADMVLVNADAKEEKHRITLEWVYNVDRRGSYEISMTVQNLQKVPA